MLIGAAAGSFIIQKCEVFQRSGPHIIHTNNGGFINFITGVRLFDSLLSYSIRFIQHLKMFSQSGWEERAITITENFDIYYKYINNNEYKTYVY